MCVCVCIKLCICSFLLLLVWNNHSFSFLKHRKISEKGSERLSDGQKKSFKSSVLKQVLKKQIFLAGVEKKIFLKESGHS